MPQATNNTFKRFTKRLKACVDISYTDILKSEVDVHGSTREKL